MNSTRNTVRARSFILFVALLPFTSTFSSAYQIQHTHKDAYAHTHTTALLLIRFECVRRIEYTAVAGTIGVAFVFEWLFILAFVDCRRSRRFSGSLHSLRIDLIVCVVRSQYFSHCISSTDPHTKKNSSVECISLNFSKECRCGNVCVPLRWYGCQRKRGLPNYCGSEFRYHIRLYLQDAFEMHTQFNLLYSVSVRAHLVCVFHQILKKFCCSLSLLCLRSTMPLYSTIAFKLPE